MNYQQTIQYLHSLINFEQTPFRYQYELNLKRMNVLLDWFGHPERKFQAVLVAGTKGKGSTANFLSSILSAHGLRTGLYTSPHLEDPRERIRIDGRMISRPQFAKKMSLIRSEIDRRKGGVHSLGHATFFEIFTLLAILYFADEGVWFGVFEIGLGGRLDASNVLNPVLSVITPISYDHEAYLGNTLSQIAREKAAVIRENGWVVSAGQERAAETVIRRDMDQKRAVGFFFGANFQTKNEKMSLHGSRFDFSFGRNELKNLRIRLAGRFQIRNAATAIASSYVLARRGLFGFREKSVRKGLETAFWPGRFEIIRKGRSRIILDGAHNGASMRELCQALRDLRPRRKQIFILGASRDKGLNRLLPPLLQRASFLIVTRSHNARAQEPRTILEKMHELKFSKPMFWTGNIREAVKLAARIGRIRTDIVITGSLFLVGEARKLLIRSR